MMCGLVGRFGRHSKKVEKAFYAMLGMDVYRGKDSTGVFWSDDTETVYTLKALGKPDHLFVTTKFLEYQGNTIVQAGHNRAATKGGVSTNNAHPFLSQSKTVVGMHNGTLNVDMPGRVYGTDSEGIINHIEREGINKTWEELKGAAALCFWEDHTLYLIRNEQRTLWTTWGHDNLWWASEPWMFDVLAVSHDLKLDEPVLMKPHALKSFTWDGKKVNEEERELTPFQAGTKTSTTVTMAGSNEVRCLACLSDVTDFQKSMRIGPNILCPTCSDYHEGNGIFDIPNQKQEAA